MESAKYSQDTSQVCLFPKQRFFTGLKGYEHCELFDEGNVCGALDKIEAYIRNYHAKSNKEGPQKKLYKVMGSVYIDESEPIIIGPNTTVEHGAMIKGPAIIGANCQVRNGAYIRGNVVTGDNCVIGHCTELKNCILLNNVQAAHFNYVGDSILGNNVHLAAGAILSNLRLDNKNIRVDVRKPESMLVETGRKKFGAILGDNCQIGCNAVLNPGTLMEPNCTVYPGVQFRGTLLVNQSVKSNADCLTRQVSSNANTSAQSTS